MPHVLLITVAVGTLINKIGKWGERGLAKKGATVVGAKLNDIGDALDGTAREFREDAIKARGEFSSEALQRKRQALQSLKDLQELAKQIGMSEEDVKRVQAEALTPTDTHPPEEKSKKNKSVNTRSISQDASPDLPKSEQPKSKHPVKIASKNTSNGAIQESGHQRVYITRSKLSSIAYAMSKSKKKTASIDGLYKADLKPLFTQPELALLSVYKEMCADPIQAFQEYRKIPERSPQENQIFQDSSPAYHLDRDCERLHNDYYNLEMPLEIEQRGEAEIDRFRAFCEENKSLIREENPIILKKLEAQFFLKNPPSKIIAKNSGVTHFDNMDLEKLEREIDGLIFDAAKFRNKDNSTNKLIRDKGYGTNKSEEAKNPDSPLYVWHNTYKVPIKAMLMHYFRVKFNPNLVFDGQLLDQLGFRPCINCCEP